MIIAALRGLLNVICKHNISIHGTLCDFVQMVITISKMKTKKTLQKLIKFKIESVAPPTFISKR